MKSFLSKYWKKILIWITAILAFVNIIHKCIAPHILVGEFAKYGPDVAASKIGFKSSEALTSVRESIPVSDNIFKIGVVLIVGLIVAVIASELANKKAPAKKK